MSFVVFKNGLRSYWKCCWKGHNFGHFGHTREIPNFGHFHTESQMKMAVKRGGKKLSNSNSELFPTQRANSKYEGWNSKIVKPHGCALRECKRVFHYLTKKLRWQAEVNCIVQSENSQLRILFVFMRRYVIERRLFRTMIRKFCSILDHQKIETGRLPVIRKNWKHLEWEAFHFALYE